MSSSRFHKLPPSRYSHKVLKESNAHGVAEYIKSKDCRNIIVMLGAGVSTSAGIPDFRSPETGLYANLARLRLPYPEAVFEIDFFRKNPVPFYTLAQELYPGQFRPTITHSFLKLLFSHNLLYRCFTQNIDTLELRAGVPAYKIIHAHGSFATQRCIDCGQSYDDEKMKDHIMRKEIAYCEKCRGLVKPDIVFFGENLPEEFIKAVPNVGLADLLIIIGTSLTVHPFASLAGMASPLCPRVLINLEKVGDLGHRPDDVLLLGKCDDMVRELARELGWDNELEKMWQETRMAREVEGEAAEEEEPTAEETPEEPKEGEEEEKAEDQVEKETEETKTETKTLKDKVDDLAEKIAKDMSLTEDPPTEPAPDEKPVTNGVVQGEKLPDELVKQPACDKDEKEKL